MRDAEKEKLYEEQMGKKPPRPAESGHLLADQWLYRGSKDERADLEREVLPAPPEQESLAMKRSGPIKRRKPLMGKRRRRPTTDALRSSAWRGAVMRRTDGLSILSGEFAHAAHHVVPKQKLRKAGLERAVWDHRNGVALTEKEHVAHHSRLRPLPFSCLPECALEFAAEHGFTDWLHRTYPKGDA